MTDCLSACQWPFGGVQGYWIIDFDEPNCLPSWGKFTDKVGKSNLTNECLTLTQAIRGVSARDQDYG